MARPDWTTVARVLGLCATRLLRQNKPASCPAPALLSSLIQLLRPVSALLSFSILRLCLQLVVSAFILEICPRRIDRHCRSRSQSDVTTSAALLTGLLRHEWNKNRTALSSPSSHHHHHHHRRRRRRRRNYHHAANSRPQSSASLPLLSTPVQSLIGVRFTATWLRWFCLASIRPESTWI